jgi:hypothetical protein
VCIFRKICEAGKDGISHNYNHKNTGKDQETYPLNSGPGL